MGVPNNEEIQQCSQKLFQANEGGQELTGFTVLGLAGRSVRLDDQVSCELPIVPSANLLDVLHRAYDLLPERRSTVGLHLVVRNIEVATEAVRPSTCDNHAGATHSIQALPCCRG